MSLKVLLNIAFITITNAVSIDCPDLINLGLGVGLNIIKPAIWTELNGDCCSATWIICVNQRVTQVKWYSMNLNGVINASAVPDKLQLLYLYNNQLTGSIPSIWPRGLQVLLLYDNQLTGSIPSTWPSGLQLLDLGVNQLNGSIPSTWPSGLQRLELHDNCLTGDISSLPSTLLRLFLGYPGDAKLNRFTGKLVLKRPQSLYINNNGITDVAVYDTSLLSGRCDLSNNPLFGNPHINNLTMCTQTGLYNASLLPNTVSSSVVASTTLVTETSSALQSATEIALLRNGLLVSSSTQTSTVVTEKTFTFVALESLWRLTWSVLVKLIINVMILGMVISNGSLKRELKTKLSFKKNRQVEG